MIFWWLEVVPASGTVGDIGPLEFLDDGRLYIPEKVGVSPRRKPPGISGTKGGCHHDPEPPESQESKAEKWDHYKTSGFREQMVRQSHDDSETQGLEVPKIGCYQVAETPRLQDPKVRCHHDSEPPEFQESKVGKCHHSKPPGFQEPMVRRCHHDDADSKTQGLEVPKVGC